MTEDMLWDVVTTAVVEDDLPAIERCLSEGLNVNRLVANDKWNLLHLHLVRIGNPPDPAIVKRLIEAGVDVNAEDSNGWTPLHFAARTGSVEAVQLLLDAGASVNVPDSKGVTPLHRALATNDHVLPLIQALLMAGADPDFTCKPNVCASRLASILEAPQIKEVRQLLAKYPKNKS